MLLKVRVAAYSIKIRSKRLESLSYDLPTV